MISCHWTLFIQLHGERGDPLLREYLVRKPQQKLEETFATQSVPWGENMLSSKSSGRDLRSLLPQQNSTWLLVLLPPKNSENRPCDRAALVRCEMWQWPMGKKRKAQTAGGLSLAQAVLFCVLTAAVLCCLGFTIKMPLFSLTFPCIFISRVHVTPAPLLGLPLAAGVTKTSTHQVFTCSDYLGCSVSEPCLPALGAKVRTDQNKPLAPSKFSTEDANLSLPPPNRICESVFCSTSTPNLKPRSHSDCRVWVGGEGGVGAVPMPAAFL